MSEKTLPELKKELDELQRSCLSLRGEDVINKIIILKQKIKLLENETAMKEEKTITQIREERNQMESEIKAAIEKFIESNPETEPTSINIELKRFGMMDDRKPQFIDVTVKSTIKI